MEKSYVHQYSFPNHISGLTDTIESTHLNVYLFIMMNITPFIFVHSLITEMLNIWKVHESMACWYIKTSKRD